MGIKGLMKLITDHCPRAIKEQTIKNYFNRKIAIDASMSLYQFLIAVRTGPDASNLTNEFGDVTSHLQGMFYRTIRMMTNGIKPVYVFDGKPPQLKAHELEKRREMRAKTEEDKKAEEAKDEERDQEQINKYKRRLVRVTPQHNEEVKRLLRLMGVPVVEAPGEAEAQCAALCKSGEVYATATEDMDALTFGTPRLVRHLTFSEARKMPIIEIALPTVLSHLKMTQAEFIDLCILCGCDYTDSIRGIGPHRAHQLISKHRNIATALKSLNASKYKVPTSFLYTEAHQLFVAPEVLDPAEVKLSWDEPDEEGLVAFLCGEKGFNEDRVRSGVKKLRASRGKGAQQRLDGFFRSMPAAPKPPKKSKKAAGKQKGKNLSTAKRTREPATPSDLTIPSPVTGKRVGSTVSAETPSKKRRTEPPQPKKPVKLAPIFAKRKAVQQPPNRGPEPEPEPEPVGAQPAGQQEMDVDVDESEAQHAPQGHSDGEAEYTFE